MCHCHVPTLFVIPASETSWDIADRSWALFFSCCTTELMTNDNNKEFRTSILRITTKKTKKRTDTRHNRKGEKMFETLVNSKLTTQLHATANSTKKIEAQNTLNPKWPKIHKNGHTQKFKWTHKSLSGKIANKMTCRDDPRINHHFFAFFAHNYFYWPASII